MMSRTLRRTLANPRSPRRLATALVLTGAALGLLASLLRDAADKGTSTYLLDTAGWLLAVLGAILEARVSTIFGSVQPAAVRRRATLLSALGIATCLGACVALSTRSPEGVGTAFRAAAAALLIGGLGAGLGGILSLAVTVGARYAADRLAESDPD